MKENTFELGPVQKAWIASLRANPERQHKDSLGVKFRDNSPYKACCLGEGGLIAGVCEWNDRSLGYGIKLNIKGYPFECGTLTCNAHEALGLYDAVGIEKNGATSPDMRLTEQITFQKDYISLAGLNDSHYTWPMIADELENNSERWFKESK
jgi:hypothetical protein